MTAKLARFTLLSIVFLYVTLAGYLDTHHDPVTKTIDLIFSVLMMAFTCVWYYCDANERHYKRTTMLGGAIILFSLLAVPYYLYKSRPPGQKARALMKFVTVCVLCLVVVAMSTTLSS
jgi:peptidoglycan/LPS O-acetylase OafA/YrhL